MKGFVLLFFLSTAAVGSLAQSSSGYKAVLSELTDNSDPSKGAVVIHQDSRIEQLMDKRKNMKPKRLQTIRIRYDSVDMALIVQKFGTMK